MIVFNAREEYQTIQVLLNSLPSDSKDMVEIFEMYRKSRFPYVEREEERKKVTMDEIVAKEFDGRSYTIAKAADADKRIISRRKKK